MMPTVRHVPVGFGGMEEMRFQRKELGNRKYLWKINHVDGV